jgi:hypothetical protein
MIDKWEQRWIGIAIGLGVAVALTVVCYAGSVFGWWDALWAWAWRWLPQAEIAPSMAANDNLVNGGFEDGFYQYQGIGELKVPLGWEPWWHEGDKAPSGTAYRRPEWSPIDTALAAYLVHGGTYSSKMFTTYGAHNAGLYQRVKATPGQWYEFSAWVYVWSSSGTDGHKSESPQGRYRAMTCVNPWGSSQNWDDTTICGKDILDVYDSWQRVSVTFQAWGDEVTLFTKGNPWYAVRSNDSTWDDVMLREVAGPGEPCPECPMCPECPGAGGTCTCTCNCTVQ